MVGRMRRVSRSLTCSVALALSALAGCSDRGGGDDDDDDDTAEDAGVDTDAAVERDAGDVTLPADGSSIASNRG